MSPFGIPTTRLLSVLKWLLLFVLLAVVQVMLVCQSCYSDSGKALYNFLYAFCLFSLLWLGNGFLSNNLNRWVSWTKTPLKRFLVTVLAVFVYSAGVILLVNWTWYVLIPQRNFQYLGTEAVRWAMITQMIVTFIITMTVHAVAFLNGWRESAVSTERLKKEHALSRYEALKNQVNPHFLFNSLNALASLVHEEPDLAVTFIKQLSSVYRYVLDSQYKEVVPLEEELKFARQYVFLQQIRHGEGLQVTLPAQVPSSFQVPPLALQTVLENAVKHNRAWAKEPLHITVALAADYLVVENNLQPKSQHEPPSGLGLPNIQARYEMLTDRKMDIIKTDAAFTVRLPLLSFQ
ncbi:sensor histidine kinase [Rufibacter soli]